ncbi:MAG: hypothetical protein E7Z88_00675 [Cyanobacteria bacterium SIG27]|nr:hypothetical protein [Cyanobacteria bacterium SIG27]
MGLSASQARFLQLTARRGDIEYEAQQINFQRLQLSNKLADASEKYQNSTANRKMVFTFNNGTERQKVDLSYSNYKTYMNQQEGSAGIATDRYYLVSSSGNKLVVGSQEEMDKIIQNGTDRYSQSSVDAAKAKYEAAKANDTLSELTAQEIELANLDTSKMQIEFTRDENGNVYSDYVSRKFTEKDFMIVPDLDDTTNFQTAIQNGTYYFAKYEQNSVTGEMELRTEGWDVLGGGAIAEEYDKSDDAQAEAEYNTAQDRIQAQDKKLELRLDQLESDRNAIQTEMESVKKVMEDNIDSTFKIFS